MVKCIILLALFATRLAANEDKALGMSEVNPASSCNEIYQRNPTIKGSVGQHTYLSTTTITTSAAITIPSDK